MSLQVKESNVKPRFMACAIAFALVCACGPAPAHVLGYHAIDHDILVTVNPDEMTLEMVILPAEIPTASILATADSDHDGELNETESKDLVVGYEEGVREDLRVTLNGTRAGLEFQWGKASLLAEGSPMPQLQMVFHFKIVTVSPSPGRNELRVRNLCHIAAPGTRWLRFVTHDTKRVKLGKVTKVDSRDPGLYSNARGELPPDCREATVAFDVVGGEGPSAGESAAPEAEGPAARAPGTTKPSSKLLDLLGNVGKNHSVTVLVVALGLAFVYGMLHAAQPGHGKTLVAAYLVGSHGKIRHAVLLGLIVTVTHTFSVYVIAVFVMLGVKGAEDVAVILWLKFVSGVGIAAIGAWMLTSALRRKGMPHVHIGGGHHHPHGHSHDHSHEHSPDHTHEHGHDHEHDGREEQAVKPPSLGRLFALGITGGLVPCPDGIAMILAAGFTGVIAFGILLLVSFSLGLAATLVTIGILVVRGSKLITRRLKTPGRLFRWASIISSSVICLIGLGMVLLAAKLMNWL